MENLPLSEDFVGAGVFVVVGIHLQKRSGANHQMYSSEVSEEVCVCAQRVVYRVATPVKASSATSAYIVLLSSLSSR